jgi:hypothetical protein
MLGWNQLLCRLLELVCQNIVEEALVCQSENDDN